MPGEVTTQEILRKAADVIRKNGWHQGDYYEWPDERDDKATHECKVCALGAIGVAAGCDLDAPPFSHARTDQEKTALAAAVAFAEHIFEVDEAAAMAETWEGRLELINRIGGWNDDHLRTESQVIAALLVAGGATDV